MIDQHYFGIVGHAWFIAGFFMRGDRMLVAACLGVIFMVLALV